MKLVVLKWSTFLLLAVALTWANHWFRKTNGTVIEAAPGVYMVVPPLKV